MITDFQGEIGRKLTHYTASLIPVIAYFVDTNTGIIILLIILFSFLFAEISRMYIPFCERIFLRLFGAIIREDEETSRTFTGATWVFIASPLTLFLFDKPVAVSALLFLTVGDASAALIGKRWGKFTLWDKTVEGSLAFIVTSILATLWILDLPVEIKIAGAIGAAITELIPTYVDDNLAIPVISGLVMTIFMNFI